MGLQKSCLLHTPHGSSLCLQCTKMPKFIASPSVFENLLEKRPLCFSAGGIPVCLPHPHRHIPCFPTLQRQCILPCQCALIVQHLQRHECSSPPRPPPPQFVDGLSSPAARPTSHPMCGVCRVAAQTRTTNDSAHVQSPRSHVWFCKTGTLWRLSQASSIVFPLPLLS